MRVETIGKKRRRLSLTSLIDVIFLLLLFFMLSSTFTRFAAVDINAGRAGATSASQKLPDIFIRLDTNNSWKVNGAGLSADAAIEELVRLQNLGAKSAVLVVREDVTSQMMVDALERLAIIWR